MQVGFESVSSMDIMLQSSYVAIKLCCNQAAHGSRHKTKQSSTFLRVNFRDFFPQETRMAKLSKILLNSLFISSTLAQSDTQDDSSETFQVTECNDETDEVSKDIEIR